MRSALRWGRSVLPVLRDVPHQMWERQVCPVGACLGGRSGVLEGGPLVIQATIEGKRPVQLRLEGGEAVLCGCSGRCIDSNGYCIRCGKPHPRSMAGPGPSEIGVGTVTGP